MGAGRLRRQRRHGRGPAPPSARRQGDGRAATGRCGARAARRSPRPIGDVVRAAGRPDRPYRPGRGAGREGHPHRLQTRRCPRRARGGLGARAGPGLRPGAGSGGERLRLRRRPDLLRRVPQTRGDSVHAGAARPHLGPARGHARRHGLPTIPPPLPDSPKCPRCSLSGICLPDEINLLRLPEHEEAEKPEPRRLVARPGRRASPLRPGLGRPRGQERRRAGGNASRRPQADRAAGSDLAAWPVRASAGEHPGHRGGAAAARSPSAISRSAAGSTE